MNHASPPASSSNADNDNAASNLPIASDYDATVASFEQDKQAQRQQKLNFLDHLIRSIDMMIYCELSILYYMDCSMLKFLIRALPHWFNFTPKPDIIPPVPPGQRPYISTIFGTNALCILLHLVFKPPAAGEATRGYLHGGWLIDFIGHMSPVSKWRFLSLDLVCLGLQLLILSVTLEKQKVTGVLDPMATSDGVRQDHDAEEAGLLRSSDTTGEEGFEMQNLRSHAIADNERLNDSNSQLGETEARDGAHPLDSFYTGEHMLANLNIPETVRTQWKMSSATVNNTSASGMQTAASIAGRRFTVTFGSRAGIRSQP